MLEFKKEYFQTETKRHLYPTTLDISKCEVYGCKEREAFMYKIPNNYYTSNAGNIDFSLYPNGVWSDYTAIKIVEKLPYFQPSVNFNKLGDITASNLNKLKDEIKQHIVDIETAITESYVFIDSGSAGQNNIPYLPNDCVWFRNGATGNIETLPIGELYDRFQNMIDSLYKEIKDLLLVDKENMSQELRNETDELLRELNNLDTTIRSEIEKLGNKKIDEIIAEGKKQLELVQGAGGGLANRVDDLEKDKLDKGNVSAEYDTAKKIEDKIKGIYEKFKNFCPFKVGDIYVTTNSANPSSVYLGTTWSKIEGRFLLGTSSSQASKLTGGSMSKTISQANLPNVKLTVDTFSLTGAKYQAVKSFDTYYSAPGVTYGEKVIPVDSWTSYGWCGQDGGGAFGLRMKKTNYNSGTTSSANPQTSALGSGQTLDIIPAYYTTHMWLRLS